MPHQSILCLPVLKSAYPDLTKSERRIADYVLEDPKNILHQTISDLAAQTKSSEITISRFCKKIGYSGLQGLKIALAGEIFTPEKSIYQEVDPTDSYEDMAKKIFYKINEGLQDTLKLLDFSEVKKAIDILDKAKRIDIYGFGTSAAICLDIENRFIRFGMPVHAFSDCHMQITSANFLTENDAVIAVSHTGSTIDLLESVKAANENNVPVIAITSYSHSPLAKISDVVLHGMGREVNYRTESMSSRLVHLAIIDLLYTGLAIKKSDKFINNIEKMRNAIAKHRV